MDIRPETVRDGRSKTLHAQRFSDLVDSEARNPKDVVSDLSRRGALRSVTFLKGPIFALKSHKNGKTLFLPVFLVQDVPTPF